MTGAVILVCLWVVLAFVLSAIPSRDSHWRLAYLLIALGVPILVWTYLREGFWVGSLALLIGCAVLRWPVYFLWLWVKRQVNR